MFNTKIIEIHNQTTRATACLQQCSFSCKKPTKGSQDPVTQLHNKISVWFSQAALTSQVGTLMAQELQQITGASYISIDITSKKQNIQGNYQAGDRTQVHTNTLEFRFPKGTYNNFKETINVTIEIRNSNPDPLSHKQINKLRELVSHFLKTRHTHKKNLDRYLDVTANVISAK